MSSSYGDNINISIFGESHGEAIGVVMDSPPSGIKLDLDEITTFMARRSPGRNKHSTQRREPDEFHILSGFYNNRTTGTPLAAVIYNKDSKSKDYENMHFRPSHGDYTGFLRYNGYNDPRGGGHFSGRLTAPLCFAGAACKQVLYKKFGVIVGAFITQIYTVKDCFPDSLSISSEQLYSVCSKEFPVFDDKKGEEMLKEIEKARIEKDSLGGAVGCLALNMPAGIGSPMFNGLENKIAQIIMGIPGARGIEFGTGFNSITMKGSQHNDEFTTNDNEVVTKTNHHGGIIGGISSGMPIFFKTAFKPTPSIGLAQQTVDKDKNQVELAINGRHDPTIVHRATPVVEAATAIALLDSLMEGGNPIVTW